METNLLAGSENLYKYLVSIGILLIVLTVYYPLKEKQELEISAIQLEGEVKTLSYQIKENKRNVLNLEAKIKANGSDSQKLEFLAAIDKINYNNHISFIECEQKYSEIKTRTSHIKLYNRLFCIFLPIGVFITAFGFWKWYNAKQVEDKMNEKKLEDLQSLSKGQGLEKQP